MMASRLAQFAGRIRMRSALLAALFGIAGCASTIDPVSGTLPMADPPKAKGSSATLLERLSRPALPTEPGGPYLALAVERDSGGLQLVAVDGRSGLPRWAADLRPTSRPEVLGDLVVVASGEALVALDGETGHERFRVDLPFPELLGVVADAEGLFVLARSADQTQTAVVGLGRESGDTRFVHLFPGLVGLPAVHAGVLVLPLQGTVLALLDTKTGALLTRLRSEDDLITWAQAGPTGVRFGHRRVYPLDSSYDGTQDRAATLEPATGILPGTPLPIAVPSSSVPAGRSAYGRVAAYFGPDDPQWQRPYGVFYRHVYRLGENGQVAWAARLAHDVVAAVATARGLLVVDEQGQLQELAAADGAISPHLQLHQKVTSAALSHAGSWESLDPAPVVAQADARYAALLTLAGDADTRLYPSRKFAIEALIAEPQPGLTQDLLALYKNAGPLRSTITSALARLEGDEAVLIEALEQRADALTGAEHPPWAAVSEALARRAVSEAAPLMAERLLDYQTPLADMPQLADALLRLSPSLAEPALARFLGRYRRDSSLQGYPQVWLKVAALWLTHRGAQPPPTALLAWARADDTPSELRDGLNEQLSNLSQATPAPAKAVVKAEEEVPSDVMADLLPRLSVESVRATFSGHEPLLRECLVQANGRTDHPTKQLRIVMIVTGLGATVERHFLPAEPDLRACAEPIVRGLRFEVTHAKRQLVSHVVRLADDNDPVTPSEVEPERWWVPYAELAAPDKAGTLAPVAPWWQNQNPLLQRVEQGFVQRTSAPAIEPSDTGSPKTQPESAGPEDPVDAWWKPADE